jgi:Ca2+-binding EF-hand superfamily protein
MRKPLILAALLGLATAAGAQAPAAPASGISFDQWAAKARERLMALDTNHDGKISKDEFAARAEGMGGGRWGSRHGGQGGAMPASAQAGGDAPKRDGTKMFDRFDTNQDGFLDTTEINAILARRFARMDANHDGVLTEDERHAMRGGNASEQ